VDKLKAGWSNARWVLVGVVLAGSLWLFLSTVRHVPGPARMLVELANGTILGVGALLWLGQLWVTAPQPQVAVRAGRR
jgi:hypothetical protein